MQCSAVDKGAGYRPQSWQSSLGSSNVRKVRAFDTYPLFSSETVCTIAIKFRGTFLIHSSGTLCQNFELLACLQAFPCPVFFRRHFSPSFDISCNESVQIYNVVWHIAFQTVSGAMMMAVTRSCCNIMEKFWHSRINDLLEYYKNWNTYERPGYMKNIILKYQQNR